MKRVMKKILCAALAMTMTVSLAACGKKKTEETDGPAFVYVPSYETLNEEGYPSTMVMEGNNLYYSLQTYDEATQKSSTSVKKVDMTTMEATECPITLNEYGYLNSMCVDADGNIIFIENINEYDPETYDTIYNGNLLRKVDPQGNELLNIDIGFLSEGAENFYIQGMVIDSEGNFYVNSGDNGLNVLDPAGNLLFKLEVGNWIQGMGLNKEGQVVLSYFSNTGAGTEFGVVDLEKKAIGDTAAGVEVQNSSIPFLPGTDHDLMICARKGLVGYDFATQESILLADWVDCEINGDDVRGFAVMDNGDVKLLMIDYSQDVSVTQIVTLTKTDASLVPERTVLTLASMYVDDTVKAQVIRFNKEHPEYKIRIIDYMSDSNIDYDTAQTNFNNAMTSSDAPDLIDISSVSNYKKIARKGVFENLYTYLENDPQINMDDYVSNVVTAYDVNGSLIALIPSFYPSTVIGKTSEVGTEPGWTLDEMLTYLEAHPDADPFEYTTKGSMLTSLISYDMDSFVDPETSECSFDSEEFVKILEFCNRFPAEYEWSEDDETLPAKIQSGKQLLVSTSVSDVLEVQLYKMIFDEPITFIGYPTSNGSGSVIEPTAGSIAISSKCENKDVAWEFVKSFMTEEYQRDVYWGYPTLNSLLDAQYEEAMVADYYTDENGNEVEVSHSSYGWDNVSFDLYAATQEEVDQLDAMIRSLTTVSSYDDQMFTIILEEADSYFTGAKPAQDVADIIQSRISIYLSENY